MRKVILVIPMVMFSTTAFAQGQCGTMQKCVQQAVEAAFKASKIARSTVPEGAIMAFNRKKCPKGWKPYVPLNGRVIIGAGKGTGLSDRPFGDTGGAETQTLTIAQMPTHSHTYASTINGPLFDNPHNKTAAPRYGVQGNKDTGDKGGNKPHNIMQPFVALFYCERK